jgi:hypothetical protein
MSLPEQALTWCTRLNQKVHRTTRRVPLDLWVEENLSPLRHPTSTGSALELRNAESALMDFSPSMACSMDYQACLPWRGPWCKSANGTASYASFIRGNWSPPTRCGHARLRSSCIPSSLRGCLRPHRSGSCCGQWATRSPPHRWRCARLPEYDQLFGLEMAQ